jgi:hypothetical protein
MYSRSGPGTREGETFLSSSAPFFVTVVAGRGHSMEVKRLLSAVVAGPVLAVVASLVVSASAEAAPPLKLPVEEHTLSNGLPLLFAPDSSLDDVTIIVRYDVGSSDDPAGKDGLAHIVEHLMFDGSRHVPRGEYFRWIDRAGGWRGTSGQLGDVLGRIANPGLPPHFPSSRPCTGLGRPGRGAAISGRGCAARRAGVRLLAAVTATMVARQVGGHLNQPCVEPTALEVLSEPGVPK